MCGILRALVFVLLAACAAVTPAHTAHAREIRIAYDSDPVSLDIHEFLSGVIVQFAHVACDPLLRRRRDLSFAPRLAVRWEKLSDLRTRFHLRRGVKFHSGREMRARDVAFSFARLQKSDFSVIFADFVEARVVDDHTIDLISDKPAPLVLESAANLFVLDAAFYAGKDSRGRDKAAIVKHGDSFASKNISCTGPFIVTAREQGVKLEMERFRDYWDADSPGNVDRITLTPVKSAPTRVAALLSGDVDFAAPIPPADLQRVRAAENVNLVTMRGTRIITLQMNQNRRREFADARVRRAIVHAVNNAGIAAKIMRGFAMPAGQMGPPSYTGHAPHLTPRYDLQKARALMKEAGYAGGFSITMMAPNNRYVNDAAIAEAVAAMLAKINIRVDLATMPKAQYWPKVDERAADMMMIGWDSDRRDLSNLYLLSVVTQNHERGHGQYNLAGYSSAEVDALVLASAIEPDETRREKMLRRVAQILYDDAVFVPLHWQDRAWGARAGLHAEKIVNAVNYPYLGDLVAE